jgi:hypothetical protein
MLSEIRTAMKKFGCILKETPQNGKRIASIGKILLCNIVGGH